MSDTVVDVLYVKMIEKTIRRKLDEDELDAIRFGEPIFVRDYRGTWMSFRVPLYKFPHDVMPKDTDAQAIEDRTKSANIFEFAFTVGPIKKVRSA